MTTLDRPSSRSADSPGPRPSRGPVGGRFLVALASSLGLLAITTPLHALGNFTRHIPITVGAGIVGGPHANLPLLVDVSNLELSTTGNGGTPPLRFMETRGESDHPVAYSVRAGVSTVSFAGGGVTFSLGEEGRRRRQALKLDFVGARAAPPVGENLTPGVVDGTCSRLVYRDLWPGIDLVYTGDEGRLKYSFVVWPGADPGRIELAYRGATAVRVTTDGRLAVSTPTGRLEEEQPYAYQEAGGERIEVKAAFALGGDGPSDTRFGFRVGSYEVSRPLILDPVIKLIGFETQDTSEIVSLGAGASVDLATVRPGSGLASLRQTATATVLATGLTPALDTLGLRFSFRKPGNPGANQTLLLFTTGATNQWALQLTTTGQLQVQDLATLTFVGTTLGSTALSNNAWYTVRLAYDRVAGGVLQVWLDASPEISITHTGAGTAVDQVQVLAAAAAYNYDDFYLTDTATQPSLGQIVRIGVNGPGYRSDFDIVVTATNRELNVDEIPPSDTDYSGHTTATVATDLYALQSSPAGSINAVKGMWRMRGSAVAVGGTHDYAWRVQGIEASQAFTGLGATWTLIEAVWSMPPGVGGTWTQAEVDGLELGARHNGTHAQATYISWTAAMVDYDASGAAGPVTCSGAALKPWYDPSWRYRKAILVDHTRVAGDLVDFPMLVSRNADADLAANARADGFDILFTDEDGTTKLSHQIEAYDGAGNLVAWVKVPLLPTGVDKTIFMYYDNPSSPNQQSVLSTWSNGYQAVWHLSEASGAGAYILNSALANYNGTPTGTVFNASGKIDGARTFSRAATSYITIGGSGALFNAWSQFSFEFWIHPDYSSDAIWEAAGEDRFMYGNVGPVRLGRVRRSGFEPTGTGQLAIDVQFNTAGTQYSYDSIDRTAWNHVVYTYQGSDYLLFYNGLEVYRDVLPNDRLTASAFLLLGVDQATGALNGSLDEVRIGNAGRSAEWVLTEYANQNAPATFYSVCGAQGLSADLGVTKTDGQADEVPGTVVSYTITVTNNGPDTLTSLFVNDTVPAGITGTVFTPSTGAYNSVTGEWTGLNLAATQSVVLTLAGTIDPFARGNLVNPVTVLPPAFFTDPNGANDSASDTDSLIPSAELGLTKVDDLDPVGLMSVLTYTLTVRNNGPSGATSVSVQDPLPADMDLDTGPGAILPSQGTCNYIVLTRTVSCNLGNLGPTNVATVTVKVRPRAVRVFTNTASVTRFEPDPAPANDSDSETTTVEVSSLGVRFFTVTSTNEKNVLEWVNPSADYDSTEVVFRNDRFPTSPGDGTPFFTGGGAGGEERREHNTGPGSNGQTFYYAAFVHRTSPLPDSPGRFCPGRPFDNTGPVKWAFSTGATAVSPPTVGGAGVIAPSNDRVLYAMERGPLPPGGEWPGTWWPIELGDVVQSRSPVVPIPVETANPVVYLGSQDGSIYAVDATRGGNAGFLWGGPTPIGPMVQAAPAGIFSAFDGTLTFDYLLVGTRDGSGPNAFVALDPFNGTEVGRFDNGGGASGIGIINGMAAVDYATQRVYFTSHAKSGGSATTLWCLQLGPTPAVFTGCGWATPRALGDIDSSPVVRGDRVYVGSSAGGGTVYSIDAASGNPALDRTYVHGDGQVKGFVFPDRSSDDIYFATENFVWGVEDLAGGMVNKFVSGLEWGAKPSPVLFTPGSHYLYVGGGNGSLYQFDVLGGDLEFVPLGNGLAVVGAPSLDRGFDLVHVGSEAGIFYAVAVPLPSPPVQDPPLPATCVQAAACSTLNLGQPCYDLSPAVECPLAKACVGPGACF